MGRPGKSAAGDAPDSVPRNSAVRQVVTELDVAALTARIIDPERTRVVVVVTSGSRAPAQRLDARRIAAEAGPDVEVVALPTGSLTYALERGLPEDTHVFGDAARTYPVGASWHTRPHLATLRYCRAETEAHQVESQVIADARAAVRRAAEALKAPHRTTTAPGVVAAARPAAKARPGVTPATMPGAPARHRGTGSQNGPEIAPTTGQASRPTPGPKAAGGPSDPSAPRPAGGTPPSAARTLGPTPTNPRGAPARPSRAITPAAYPTPDTPTPAPSPTPPTPAKPTPARPAPTAARAVARPRLSAGGPWHAVSGADGLALATHLTATRSNPVLVVTTAREGAPARIDADDLYQRVGEIADVVMLHTGPASWALAHAMPALTEVYGGAGRVYPIDLDWMANPYRVPIRFCWPHDDPRAVADQLEDDAYAAANLAGLTAARSITATVSTTGEVRGPMGRHHVLMRLDRGGEAALLVDELYPDVEPERLLRRGQTLTGRVEPGHLLSPFVPDPIDDDPHARAAATYSVGDVVLARVIGLDDRSGSALLHPRVQVALHTDDDVDLRNLLAVDDVVVLTLTEVAPERFAAELADSAAPSVPTIPVLPDGPPWLTERDLPAPEPEPVPTPEPEPEPEAARVPPPTAAGLAPTVPAVDDHSAKLAALQAENDSLTSLLERARTDVTAQARQASRAREEAQRLRRQVKSLKDQHQAYRDRIEGRALFSDPEEQLRYDLQQTWLRRTPEPQRRTQPLAGYTLGPTFLDSLRRLEGIATDKVYDVLVEVLTDRAKDIPGRDLHPLRESESSQTQRRRADGGRAWRCALQVSTPSARRLHYWKLPDGTIELDAVGTHDSL